MERGTSLYTGDMHDWRPDILGVGFECREIDLGSDDEGPLVATLVRHLPEPRGWWQRMFTETPLLHGVDVLYVHGWSDYFFHKRLARFWASRGANFYALDLRKYGRSLRPGQTAGYIEDLTHYDDEINRALQIMQAGQSDRPLILFGHSTGGLVLSLWAARHPGAADALVLNSPWLEFQFARMGRQILTPLLDLRARLPGKDVSLSGLGYYARAQQEAHVEEDPLEVNLDWRPERSHPVSGGWLRAVLHGHELVDRGLDIAAPVCVLLSASSTPPLKWSEDLVRSDTVLDVQEVARAALKLGDSITVEWINDALHDVFLSRREPRDEAYRRLDRWVRGWAASR